MRTGSTVPAFPDWVARKLVAHIDVRLSLRMHVSELAGLLQMSRSHFHRAFWQTFGMPPHAFVTLRRIYLAQRLLRETQAPLSQISLACGMFDQAHFARTFRRYVGETPRRWRKTQQQHHRPATDTRRHAAAAGRAATLPIEASAPGGSRSACLASSRG